MTEITLTPAQTKQVAALQKAADAYVAVYRVMNEVPREAIAPVNVPFRKECQAILSEHRENLKRLGAEKREARASAPAASKNAPKKASTASKNAPKKASKKVAKIAKKTMRKPISAPAVNAPGVVTEGNTPF